jgi:hypothetical protein
MGTCIDVGFFGGYDRVHTDFVGLMAPRGGPSDLDRDS